MHSAVEKNKPWKKKDISQRWVGAEVNCFPDNIDQTILSLYLTLSLTAAVSLAEKFRNSLHRADGTSRSAAAAIFTPLASVSEGSGNQPVAQLSNKWANFSAD